MGTQLVVDLEGSSAGSSCPPIKAARGPTALPLSLHLHHCSIFLELRPASHSHLSVKLSCPPPFASESLDHHGWRRQDPLPKTRLVARRWLVRPTEELEVQHSRHGFGYCRAYGHHVEGLSTEGIQISDAPGRCILSEPVVSQHPPTSSATLQQEE
jgi:hypothetical protein